MPIVLVRPHAIVAAAASLAAAGPFASGRANAAVATRCRDERSRTDGGEPQSSCLSHLHPPCGLQTLRRRH